MSVKAFITRIMPIYKSSYKVGSLIKRLIFSVDNLESLPVGQSLNSFLNRVARNIFILFLTLSSSLAYIQISLLEINILWSFLSSLTISMCLSIFIMNLYTYSVRMDHSSNLSREYPVFILLFAVFHYLNLYSILMEVANVFGDYLRYTREYIRRWIASFYISSSSLESIIFSSLEKIPSNDLRTFLLNYLRVVSAGGDVKRYVSTSLSNMIERLRLNWEDSWRSAVGRLEMIILIFGLTPSIVMSVITLATADLISMVFISMTLILPIIGFFTYVYLDSQLIRIPISTNPRISIRMLTVSMILAVLSQFILVSLNTPFIESIAISTSIFLVYPSLNSIRIWMIHRRVDKELSMLLRNMEELMRYGFSLSETIMRIDLNRFSKEIRTAVRRIIHFLEYRDPGVYIFEDKVYSGVAKLSFLMIHEIIKSGGGLDELIFLREVIDEYVKMYSRKVRYAIVPLLTGIFVIVSGVYNFWSIKEILLTIPSGTSLMLMSSYMAAVPWLSLLFKIVSLMNTFITGFLIAKVIHDDIHYTYPVLILLLSLSISLLIFQI